MPIYVYKCVNDHHKEIMFSSYDEMKISELIVEKLGLADNRDALISVSMRAGKITAQQFICFECGELLKRQVTAPGGFKGVHTSH